MATATKRKRIEDLQRQVDQIDGSGWGFRDFRAAEEPVPAQTAPEGRTVAPSERGPFGRWLMEHAAPDGPYWLLVRAAKLDPQFPVEGDPEAVRARLRACMADGEMFEAVDEAELDWSSY